MDEVRGTYGFFVESNDKRFDKLISVITQKFQTITYFGIDKFDLVSKIIETGAPGVDRIVPVGKALELDVFWDGYDILKIMARQIVVT